MARVKLISYDQRAGDTLSGRFFLSTFSMNDTNHSRHLGPAAGGLWFQAGLAAVRREPLSLAVVAIFYMSTMAILSILPVVGSLAASLFMPFGTVFLGRAVKVTMQGKQPGFALLAEIFRDARHRRALFNVGLVFAVALSLTNLVFDWLAADAVAQWGSLENGRLDWSTVSQHIPYDAMIAAAVIYIPALMATWFAPLLVSEKSMSAGKALFYSFFGCLRNILAVIVLGVVLSVAIGVAAALLVFLISFLELTGSEMFLITPFAFIASTITYACYWPMYQTLFEAVGNRDLSQTAANQPDL